MTNQQRQQAGFSLPELMIASSVLLGLATVSAGSYSRYLKHETEIRHHRSAELG